MSAVSAHPIKIGSTAMSAPIFLMFSTLITIALAVGGCGHNADSEPRRATGGPARPDRPEPITAPSTQMTTQTGTLRGGMMAIGGESTGWILVGDGAVGGLDLDVSQVQDAVTRLDGKRVNVTGPMIDKRYVERGPVRMMRVEKIEEAK